MKLMIFLLISSVSAFASDLVFDNFSPNFHEKFSSVLNVTSPRQGDFGTTSSTVGGGIYVGNGGDALVCKDKVELLDIFEGKKVYEYNDLNTLSYEEIVQEIIQRLSVIDPYRAIARHDDNLQLRYKKFMTEAKFTMDQLDDLVDSGISSYPRDCKLEQLAYQFKDLGVDGERYWVDQYLWNKLDNLSKAALVAHEFFAGEYFKQGHRLTLFARSFVSFLFSDEFGSIVRDMERTESEENRYKTGLVLYYHYRLFKHTNVKLLRPLSFELVEDSFSRPNHIKFKLLSPARFGASERSDQPAGLNKVQFSVEINNTTSIQTFDLNWRPRVLRTDDEWKSPIKLVLPKLKGHRMDFYPMSLYLEDRGRKLVSMLESPRRAGEYRSFELNTLFSISTIPFEDGVRRGTVFPERSLFKNNLPENLFFKNGLSLQYDNFVSCFADPCGDLTRVFSQL